MNILAIETSTEYCSVALWQDGKVVEHCHLAGQKHSEMLVGMVDGLLQEAECGMKDLGAIAYGMGPGSFTGVRIACGATQGLAFGASLPVVGVCTLEALAEITGRKRVIAVLDARMGELYLAAYERTGQNWETVIEPCLCKPEEAPDLPGDGWFAAGSGIAQYGERLRARYSVQIQDADGAAIPSAAAIASLGAVRFLQGLGVDGASALPLYLRDKVALKTSERNVNPK